MVRIDYQGEGHKCIITCDPGEDHWDKIRLLYSELSRDFGSSATSVEVPWHSFVANLGSLNFLVTRHGIKLQIPEETLALIRQAQKKRRQYSEVNNAERIPEDKLQPALKVLGFKRELKKEQIRNVSALSRLDAGATFSVPGAGKTTEAIAFYWLKRKENQKLLVICPKNAFPAWEEQFQECLENPIVITRLSGGANAIDQKLRLGSDVYLITYDQFILVVPLISAFLHNNEVFVFLDESHRIKGGDFSERGRQSQAIAHLPVGKLIMSGTPMPNRPADLITQFKFLFPEQSGVTEANIIELIKPVYVRTTKAELPIPPLTQIITPIPFTEPQRRLYDLVRSEEYRKAQGILKYDKEYLRRLGGTYIRLLQIASNPALLLNMKGGFSNAIRETIEFGESAKIRYAVFKARKLANEGKKVLIWSGFVENVELIARRLADLGALYIHGQVDAGSDEEEDTREGIVRQFHDKDAKVFALIANPAACSEGISLHTVCHHAIYIDRDYNAAKFLQSQDRIHRIGLPPDQSTTIEILASPDSIDERIHRRLSAKIQRMADVIEDKSLRQEAEVIDLDSTGFTDQDADDLVEHLKE